MAQEFPKSTFHAGGTLNLPAAAAGGTVRFDLGVPPVPGQWGERGGRTVGPFVVLAVLQLVQPANWVGVAVSAALRTSSAVANELDAVHRVEDTQAATGAGVLLRATLPPLPNVALDVLCTFGALGGDSELRLTWKLAALPTLVREAPDGW